MKEKNGFTLIELLAVIVILAIIALIAVPVILNIIEKARLSAFKDTAYGIVNAGELYFAERMLDTNMISQNELITLPDTRLSLKGEVPEGKVAINTEGKVALAINNGRYCAIKYYDDTEFELTEDIEDCNLYINGIMTSTNNCINEGTCPNGTKVNVQVSPLQNYNFYVVSDLDKMTLIMSENLGDTIEWYSDGDDTTTNEKNNLGPITAINYLDELTDEEWSNVPKRAYKYSGIAHDGETRKYTDIMRTMRARIITYEELDSDAIGCERGDDGSCPDWIYANLDSDENSSLSHGYWTSTAYANNANYASNVSYRGTLFYNDVSTIGYFGVRPVIELSK